MGKHNMTGGTDRAGMERVVVLECSDCCRERPHRLRYKNDIVAEMICTECGRAIVLAATSSGANDDANKAAGRLDSVEPGVAWPRVARTLGVAAADWSARAATKPWRMLRQVRKEGPRVFATMPKRTATKPLRLVRELRHKVQELL